MPGSTGCVLKASDASPGVVKDLVSRLGLTALFVRGTMRLPGLKGKAPASSADGTVPGLRLAADDSALRSALDAARDCGVDAYLVLSNPLAGAREWADLLATDNGGRSAAEIEGDGHVLCPNQPKLLKWLAAAAAEAVKTYEPAGMLLDDFSLGAPDKPDTLFMCWCDLCRTQTAELGYDTDRIQLGMQGARSKLGGVRAGSSAARGCGIGQIIDIIGYDTGFLDWLNFRADCVSACLYEVRQALAAADTGLRVGVLTKAPTVSVLAGQRRADTSRDTTLADFSVPLLCGPGAGAAETIAAHAQLIGRLFDRIDDAGALELSARVHGYGGLPVPASAEELVRAPGKEFVAASAAHELRLATATGGEVPQWPAISTQGLAAETVAEAAALVNESDADGLVYLGAPG